PTLLQKKRGKGRALCLRLTPGGGGRSFLHQMTMIIWLASAALLSLLVLGSICGSGPGISALSASALAKDKPLAWKPIEDALLRVNDAPPKEWGVYRTGKKNEPLLLQMGNRVLLIEIRDRQVFELSPSKIERKSGEILWSLADRPAKPLATSNWVADDIGAAFIIKVK